MLRFSDIPSRSFVGKSLRSCLRVVPKTMAVRVLQGPLRGARWIVGAQTHGMWLGSYESAKQLAIAGSLRPGQVFFDIGANVGFYSLLGARRVGPSGTVVAVEPSERNIAYLDRHRELNGFSNIVVVRKAVSDFEGTARFSAEGESTGRLDEDGSVDVAVTTLDALSRESGLKPDVVKVDIEGAETALLRGAADVLGEARPVIFMAVHARESFEELRLMLPAIRYAMRSLDGRSETASGYWDEVVLTPL